MVNLTGKSISHYRLTLQLSQGSWSQFYRAYDQQSEKTVGLLIIPVYSNPELLFSDLDRHIECIKKVTHANIAPPVSCELSGEFVLIEFDCQPRNTLKLRKDRQPPLILAARQLLPVARALWSAHRQGIIHGNLKPESILIDLKGEPNLYDFGIDEIIARHVLKTLPGIWITRGPLEYLSPERLSGEKPDAQSDLYSFGKIFIYLLAGDIRSEGKSAQEQLLKQMAGPAPDQVIPAGTPGAVKNFFKRLLEPLSANRINNMLPVVKAIEAIKKGEKPKNGLCLSDKQLKFLAMLALFILAMGAAAVGYFGINQHYFYNNLSAQAQPEPHLVQTQVAVLLTSMPTPSPAVNATVGNPSAILKPISTKPAALPSPKAVLPTFSPTPLVKKTVIARIFNQEIPVPEQAIDNDTARVVSLLSRWGLGKSLQNSWSPDGTSEMITTTIGIFLFDPGTLTMSHHLETGSKATSAIFSQDGRLIVAGHEDGLVTFWDRFSWQKMQSFFGHSRSVRCLSISPDGKWLASGSDDADVIVWDLQSKEMLKKLRGHLKGVSSVEFSTDGKWLVSGSSDSTVKVWDSQSWTLVATIKHTTPIHDISISPDGITLATVDDLDLVHLWDIPSGSVQPALLGRITSKISSISFSPDGKSLASGQENGMITVWDTTTKKILWTVTKSFLPHILGSSADYENIVNFSPDGSILSSVNWDNAIYHFNASSGKLISESTEFGDFASKLVFSNNGRMLAAQSPDGSVKLWDVYTATVRHRLVGEIVPGDIFAPDSTKIALRIDSSTVRIFDTESGVPIYTFSGHSDLQSIMMRDTYLAAGNGRDIKVWSMNTAMEIITTERVAAGCTIVTASDGVKWAYGTRFNYVLPDNAFCEVSRPGWVIDMDLGNFAAFSGPSIVKILYRDGKSYKDLFGIDNLLAKSVDIAKDNRLVAAAVSDQTIRIWDITGAQLIKLIGHNQEVYSVAFSPDQKLLASSSLDGTIRIWGVP